ncbi:transglutaminase-like cysteine peptidase [Bradyrhizobium sp. G127]|uniref:transglutaminase-like cysteine peptidase n=1 Tax=Bradyrhizobium sp. G127 TaxID=2904800 RepID=UPI001F1B6822|nr:transglutaminase-like cysteine peptidase [Bradyrhizobium sp. G127]MCF2523643.1 transglutaminase-like cysteine peptidase [Bradyrhizobium sp. G127]
MSVFITARAGALAFVLAINVLCESAHAAAYAPPDSFAGPLENQSALTSEPFGLPTSMVSEGPLRAKWVEVERAIAAEASIIAGCANDPTHCASRPALRFLEIVKAAAARQGLARLGEVNRAINLAIRPVSDRAQYGVEDRWASPLATLASGAGDCEDYAIAKLVALRAAGVPAEDLRLVIIRETATGEDHAVVTARADGHWRVLDNRTFVMIDDSDLVKYRALFAIDAEGAKRFEQPAFAQAARNMQVRPAEIDTRDPATDANMSATGPQAAAADEFILTLAM